jgi:hypothetical protein
MKRKIYHVTPAGESWRVKRVGAGRAASIHESKRAAVGRAKELAQGATLGQVRVHGGDGGIQTEWTYGNDPGGRRG